MRRRDLEQVNLLELAPVRIAPWTLAGERVVLHRPPPRSRGFTGLGERVSCWLAPARIRLDALGGFTWRRLDGRATVGEIAAALRAEFGEQADAAEERVGRFVRDLHREGFVAYPGFDEVPSTGSVGPMETEQAR